jgi:hypothetical protein
MRIVRDATEEEMVRAFVEAEAESPHYGPAYARAAREFGSDASALFSPDSERLRAKVLRAVRGYPGSALFTGFPSDADWKLATVPVGELGRFLYLREHGWVALSGGTRLVRDGAANVETALGVKKAAGIVSTEEAVRAGKRFRPIIAAAENDSAVHILAEGHTRATAYVRALDAGDEIEVVIGCSPNLRGWHFF